MEFIRTRGYRRRHDVGIHPHSRTGSQPGSAPIIAYQHFSARGRCAWAIDKDGQGIVRFPDVDKRDALHFPDHSLKGDRRTRLHGIDLPRGDVDRFVFVARVADLKGQGLVGGLLRGKREQEGKPEERNERDAFEPHDAVLQYSKPIVQCAAPPRPLLDISRAS